MKQIKITDKQVSNNIWFPTPNGGRSHLQRHRIFSKKNITDAYIHTDTSTHIQTYRLTDSHNQSTVYICTNICPHSHKALLYKNTEYTNDDDDDEKKKNMSGRGCSCVCEL